MPVGRRNLLAAMALLAWMGLLTACQIGIPSPVGNEPAIRSFLYQLQAIDLAAIGQTCYDLIVIDYSADGGQDRAFTADEIAALSSGPGGPKTVLAYLSIGEAEEYRFYWQPGWRPGDPAWLDAENPNWAGNYKVRYWDREWQRIVLTFLDRLLDAGFDGAYLDLIDAYEHYENRGRATAAAEMVSFVEAIRVHARKRDPDFRIVVQNAAELVERFPMYLGLVDGIGQEDIYYGYAGDDRPTPSGATAEMEAHLDTFLAAGKLVLTIDYATTPSHIDEAYARSRAKGYVPFVTTRDLDKLILNPGHDPCSD
jgi:cysteinyl-tRNA synthetase